MNPILRNIVSVVAGIVSGNCKHGDHYDQRIHYHASCRSDVTTMEGLKSRSIYLSQNISFPFLAHALVMAGAWVASKIAATYRMTLAGGCVFLVGGISNVLMLPSPLWFTILI